MIKSLCERLACNTEKKPNSVGNKTKKTKTEKKPNKSQLVNYKENIFKITNDTKINVVWYMHHRYAARKCDSALIPDAKGTPAHPHH